MTQSDLVAFLARHRPFHRDMAVWEDGLIHLRVVSYLSDALPPLPSITSVRALVFRDDTVLVSHNPETRIFGPVGVVRQGKR